MAKKAKQGHLAGMEPPSIPEIDDAANSSADVRRRRMALTEQETTAADALLALMHEHELKVYDCPDGKKVEISALEKIKVRRPKEESNGEE